MKQTILLLSILFCTNAKSQSLQQGQPVSTTVFNQVFNYNKPTLDLNQYKNKIIVFDFWATYCSGCIKSFPKIDSLQKKFHNEIQIILVNREPLTQVNDFFAKRKKISIPQVPFICNDSILQQLFPHEGVPAIAWLNKEHRFLFLTNGTDLNEQSVAKLLNNEQVNMATHQTGHRKINNIISKEYHDDLQFVSCLTTCIVGESESYSNTLKKRSTLIQIKCAAATELYITAFNEEGKYNFKRVGRLVTDFDEPYKYSKPVNEADVQQWREQFAYRYELLLPRKDSSQKYEYMKQDLQRFFHLTAGIKYFNKKCIVLEAVNGAVQIGTKGAAPLNSFRRSSTDGDITTVKRELINQPFQVLLHNMAYWFESEYNLPFESTVMFTGNIDICLSGHAVESLNIKKLNEELKPYGLVLVEKEMPLQCLYLSDK